MSKNERSFRVEAFVLRHWDYGETDRMVVLYTHELGKLQALAKGARKPRSRKAGHLEPFTRLSLLLAKGHSFHFITQAETLDAYLPLRQDLNSLGLASYVLELIERFSYEGEENRALYQLAVQTLQRLIHSSQPNLVLRYFDIHLLDLVGFRPQLFHCVVCNNEIKPQDQYFSAYLGGVLCPQCGSAKNGVRFISMNGLKYLRHFQRSNFNEASRAVLSETLVRELENILHYYIIYQLERGLNTPAFLRRIAQGEEA